MNARWSPGRAAVRAAVFVIQLYRNAISPLRPPSCRFTPTCSQYAVAALTEFGAIRGGWMSTMRLLKCGPWHSGGWDPIPERSASRAEGRAQPSERGCAGSEGPTSTVQQGGRRTRV